jgi:hypothetical protein
VLPMLDLSTVYELKSTNLTAHPAGQDYPIPYANFRDFLSTTAMFNSTGLTAGLKNGSDVNYWALQSANFTNIWKIDPLLVAQKVREILQHGFAAGHVLLQPSAQTHQHPAVWQHAADSERSQRVRFSLLPDWLGRFCPAEHSHPGRQSGWVTETTQLNTANVD